MSTIEESTTEAAIKDWVSKKMSPRDKMDIASIIQKYEKFDTFEDFISHAINMNLVWWSNNPENMLGMMSDTVVTDAQKQFVSDFAAGKYNPEISDVLDEKQDAKESEDEIFRLDDTNQLSGNIVSDNISGEWLEYDGYPLLFKFYSRILPARLSLAVLGKIITKNKPYAELEEFQNKSYDLVSGMADMIRKFEDTKRNKKLSTGMPLSVYKISEAIGRKNKKDVANKVASSEFKFKNQYVGKVKNPKKSKKKFFEGILFVLGLIKAENIITKENKNLETRIHITKEGLEFLRIENPVLMAMSEKSKASQAFSEEGVKFLINLIKTRKELDLEKIFCLNVIETLKTKTTVMSDELDKVFVKGCQGWVSENSRREKEHNIGESLRTHKAEIEKPKKKQKQTDLQAWRVATMGRLSELGIVEWSINDHSQSTYSKGVNFELF